jgi:hypothetical protein
MMNTLISCNLYLQLPKLWNKKLLFGNKNYLFLDIFLLFKFLSVKKFKNFKKNFTNSFFLKLNKKKLLSNVINFYVGP